MLASPDAANRRIRPVRAVLPLVKPYSAIRHELLGMGLDTGTANGRLMLNLRDLVAQFEREVMLEKQREGIAKAKGEGK